MKIKARELNGKVLDFEVVESIDTRGTIEPIQLDYDQPSDDYFNYNFYHVTYADDVDMNNVEFLKRYCELDTEFTQLLNDEFSIKMEVLN